MFKIDYNNLLKDIGIKDNIISVFRKNSKLSDAEIEKSYNEKLEYHADMMNQFIQDNLGQYFNIKKEKKDINLECELDKMVDEFIKKNNLKEE